MGHSLRRRGVVGISEEGGLGEERVRGMGEMEGLGNRSGEERMRGVGYGEEGAVVREED
jgi:hypothetical protein